MIRRETVVIDELEVKRGAAVMVKSNGLVGRIWDIGRCGLVALTIPSQPIATSRVYGPWELAVVRGDEAVTDPAS